MLVRAFRLVQEATLFAHLLILGEGQDANRIEQVVRDAGLARHGASGLEQNPYRFMNRTAVFASSSQWEGFGVALVEALALNIPVVSTNCTHGPAEILGDGRFGALLPVGDHEAMAQALLAALGSPRHSDCSSHLRQFTVQSVVSQYLSVIQQFDA